MTKLDWEKNKANQNSLSQSYFKILTIEEIVSSIPSHCKPKVVMRNSVRLSKTEIIDALDQLENLFLKNGNDVGWDIVVKAQERRGYITEKQAKWLEQQIQRYGI